MRRTQHSGFTLLEVLLASALSVILLGGLYVAFEVTIESTDVTRAYVAENNLAKSIIHRMELDFSSPLGPMPPKSGGGNTDSSTDTGTTETTDPATATDPAVTSTDPAATEDPSTDAESTVASKVPLQAGVYGTDQYITLFVSSAPLFQTDPNAALNPDLQLPADLKRITYYIASDGIGLCRQERPWVLADGVQDVMEPDYSTELSDVIAPEVRNISIEYFDPMSGWLGSWDGSLPALDGTSTSGPPRAVRVLLTLEFMDRQGNIAQKIVSHVFPLRATNGLIPPPAETTPDPATETTPAEGMRP